MDFRLVSIADAFRSEEYRGTLENYPSFAFVLATGADNGLIPELLMHFPELHLTTSRFMLVIAPKFNMNKAKNVEMNAEEIANVLSSGRFYDHYGGLYHDVSESIKNFTSSQTSEAIKFARFCGIGVDQLPCIVFFSSLADPNAYLIRPIKNQDANSVITDFRNIIAVIEREFTELTELQEQISSLADKRTHLGLEITQIEREKQEKEKSILYNQEVLERKKIRLDSLEANPSHIPGSYIKRTKKYHANSELAHEIEETRNNIIEAFHESSSGEPQQLPSPRFTEKLVMLASRPFHSQTVDFIRSNLESNQMLLLKFERYVKLVRSQDAVIVETEHQIGNKHALENLKLDIKKRREGIDRMRLENAASDVQPLHMEVDRLGEVLFQLDFQRQHFIRPDILQIIRSLDQEKFYYQAFRDLAKAAPPILKAVAAGASIVTGVWNP